MKNYIAHLVLAIVCAFIFCVGLAQFYLFGEKIFRDTWLGIAVINSILAIGIALAWKFFRARQPAPAIIYYAPAIVVFLGSIIAAVMTRPRQTGFHLPDAIPLTQIAWIFWIPVVEEWVFRGGFSVVFQRWVGTFTGSYLSALAFSFIHSVPTVERLMNGQAGLFLGPLILGFACDLLVIFSGSIRPAIAFHMACNGTVLVFNLIDPRWLEWLKAFYQHQ